MISIFACIRQKHVVKRLQPVESVEESEAIHDDDDQTLAKPGEETG